MVPLQHQLLRVRCCSILKSAAFLPQSTAILHQIQLLLKSGAIVYDCTVQYGVCADCAQGIMFLYTLTHTCTLNTHTHPPTPTHTPPHTHPHPHTHTHPIGLLPEEGEGRENENGFDIGSRDLIADEFSPPDASDDQDGQGEATS